MCYLLFFFYFLSFIFLRCTWLGKRGILGGDWVWVLGSFWWRQSSHNWTVSLLADRQKYGVMPRVETVSISASFCILFHSSACYSCCLFCTQLSTWMFVLFVIKCCCKQSGKVLQLKLKFLRILVLVLIIISPCFSNYSSGQPRSSPTSS